MVAAVPVATTTAWLATSLVMSPPGSSTSTTRGPARRPRPRTMVMCRSVSQGRDPVSSQFAVNRSRNANVTPASAEPVTAEAAPGTRRAAASTSPGRSRTLEGMHPQYEHSPPTSSRSTMATDSPASAQRPATFSPAGPAPTTTTSNV